MQQFPYISLEPGTKPGFQKHFAPTIVLRMQPQIQGRLDRLRACAFPLNAYGFMLSPSESGQTTPDMVLFPWAASIPHWEGCRLVDHRNATFWNKKKNLLKAQDTSIWACPHPTHKVQIPRFITLTSRLSPPLPSPPSPTANVGQTVFEKVSKTFPYMSYTSQ